MIDQIKQLQEMRAQFVRNRDVWQNSMNRATFDRYIAKLGNQYLVRLYDHKAEFAGNGVPKYLTHDEAVSLDTIDGIKWLTDFQYARHRRNTCIDAIEMCNDRIAELTAQAPQA